MIGRLTFNERRASFALRQAQDEGWQVVSGTANQKPEPGFWTSATARPSKCEPAKGADATARRLREYD